MPLFRPSVKRLGGCRQGATAIEFGLLLPVLTLLLMGIIELALVFFTYAVLEGATSIGSRIGKTGFATGGMTREAYIRSEIERLSGGYIDTDLLMIDILSYDTFNNVGQPEPCAIASCDGDTPPVDPDTGEANFTDVNGDGSWSADQGAAGAGGNGSIVLYRVSYPWEFFTPLMGSLLGDANGRINISAVATVRNEAFNE